MTVWFHRGQRMNSETMREIANTAGVSWGYQSIVYRGQCIGFADGDSSDVTALQDAAESILGYRPVEIDAPAQTDLDV